MHRLIGRLWVVLILFVSISSFWIRGIRPGHFSLLHILSVVTLVTVSLGFFDARRGNLPSHKGNMRGSWFGLAGAFIYALVVPSRDIPQFVVTEPAEAALAALAALVVVVTTVAVVALGRLTATRRDAPPA